MLKLLSLLFFALISLSKGQDISKIAFFNCKIRALNFNGYKKLFLPNILLFISLSITFFKLLVSNVIITKPKILGLHMTQLYKSNMNQLANNKYLFIYLKILFASTLAFFFIATAIIFFFIIITTTLSFILTWLQFFFILVPVFFEKVFIYCI